jgi:hypothetical protein
VSTTPPIADLIDLDRYPIQELGNPAIQALIAQCQASLRERGAVSLEGFIRPEAVAAMARQGAALASRGYPNDDTHNVYFTEIDETLPAGDPRGLPVRSAQKAVAMDILPDDFGVKRVYAWDGLTAFVTAALEQDVLYRSEDTLDGCNMTVYDAGDELGWHFDNSEFSVTLMIQPAERGGIFEYVPATRSPGDERYDEVAAIVQGKRAVLKLDTRPGTLAFFRGRYALHRVSPVEGSTPRLNSVLTYSSAPGHRLSPLTAKLFYGRESAS